MADHTKGELAYSFEGDGSARVLGQIGDDTTSVASVAVLTMRHRSVDEVRANAQRLALCWNSHDDLLAALRAIVDRDFTYFDGVVVGAQRDITFAEVHAARAAIAKATGSTS